MNAFSLFGDLKVGTSAFENSLHEAEVRLNQTQRAIQDTEKSAERMGKTTATVARNFEKLNDTVETNRDRMRQAVDAYERGEISANKLSTVLRQTDTRVNGLNSRLKDTQSRLNDAGRSASSFGSTFKQVFSATLLAGGVEGVTRSIANFGKESVQMFASLDKLVRMTANLDRNFRTADALNSFREDIQKLSTEIPHSAESIARASFSIKSAFSNLTQPELIDYLREFGRAATASGSDIDQHAQSMAALAKSYNITRDELPKLSALITSSFGQALASDSQVAAGFNTVLNAARSTKQPLEDLVGAMSTLQSVSSDAARNTNLLENVYAKLTDQKYIEGIEKLGVSVFDAQGNFRALNPIVNDLAKELAGLSDKELNEALGFAKDMQAREGLKALIRGVDGYTESVKGASAGTEEFDAKVSLMAESADAKLQRLENRWKSIKTEFGAALVNLADDTRTQFNVPAPQLDSGAWSEVIGRGIRTAIVGAGAASQPVATQTGYDTGLAVAQGMKSGIAGGQSGVINAAVDLAYHAYRAAKGALGIQSPSKVFHGIGQDTAQGFIDGLNSLKSVVSATAASVFDISQIPGIGKGDKEGVGLLSNLIGEVARFNATTKLQEVQLELTAGKYAKLNTAVKDRILLAASEIDAQGRIRDVLGDIVRDIQEYTKNEDKLGNIIRLFGDPKAADQLKKQADALGITVEHMRTLAKLGATSGLAPLGIEGIVDNGPTVTGTGLSEGLGTDIASNLLPPPELKPAWEDFWATLTDRANGFRDSLPSIRESIGENLLGSLAGIGDVIANAVSRADGTLKGFFTAVAQGFGRMAQQIIADLIRIAVYQTILKLVASAAGAGVGGLGDAAGGIGQSIGAGASFASGGFTGMGGRMEPAGIVHRGEYVIPQNIVKKVGVGFFDALVGNRMPSMASGGYATPFVPSFAGATTNNTTTNNQPVVNNFHFHANQNGQFSKESAEQATRKMVSMMNRTSQRAS